MNRKDYRKMMQRKKMNKIYSKSLILGLLGLGVTISGNTVKAEAREWKANTSTTIKKGDTEYKVLWGDTLSLISRDSGITIETLTRLNNILDANLIYEGNVIYFGDGANVTVKDTNGNTIAETPLTSADKAGIKEAQNNNTNSTNSTTVSNVNTSNGSNNVNSNTNAGTGNSGNDNNTSTKPTKPSKPEKPTEEGNGSENGGNGSETGGNGSETEKPVISEFDKRVIYQTEDGENVSQYDTKVKVAGISTESGAEIEYGFIDTTEKLPAGYKIVNEERDSNVKVYNTTANIVIYVEKIKDETPVEPEVKEFDKNVIYQDEEGTVYSYFTKVKVEGTVKSDEGYDVEYGFIDTTKELPEGYKLVDEKESNVKVYNTTMNIVIKVEKIKGETPVEPEKPYVPQHQNKYVTVNVDTDGNILQSTEGYDYISESTDTGVTTTASNGDTVTTYTTTIIWKLKEIIPPVTPTAPLWPVSGEQFGGRKTPLDEFINPANQATSNGYTFPSRESASAYGYANMEKAEFDPETTGKGFFMSSVEMKVGSVRWVVEWNYLIQ